MVCLSATSQVCAGRPMRKQFLNASKQVFRTRTTQVDFTRKAKDADKPVRAILQKIVAAPTADAAGPIPANHDRTARMKAREHLLALERQSALSHIVEEFLSMSRNRLRLRRFAHASNGNGSRGPRQSCWRRTGRTWRARSTPLRPRCGGPRRLRRVERSSRDPRRKAQVKREASV